MYNGKLTMMAVHAHPDDELIGTGGVLARYAEEGLECVLVTCTRGEVGEIHDPDLTEEEARPILGDIRMAELKCALDLLGVQHSEQLGYRDSGMINTEDNNDPRCFNMADLDEATGRLVKLVRHYQPDVIVTYNENGGYGHPDHINAHKVAAAAFDAAADPARYPDMGEPWQPQKLYYTAWNADNWQKLLAELKERGLKSPWDDEEENKEQTEEERQKRVEEWMAAIARVTTKVDNRRYTNLIFRAAQCHRTQFPQDSLFYTTPEDLRELAFGEEWFVRVKSHVEVTDEPETDLFTGLRARVG